MRWQAWLWILVLAFGGVRSALPAAETPDAAAVTRLRENAAARRQDAEKRLAELRAQVLRQRTAQNRRLQAAFAALQQAEDEASSARRELAELKKLRDEFRRDNIAFRHKFQILLQELASAAETAAPANPAGGDMPTPAQASALINRLAAQAAEKLTARAQALTVPSVRRESGSVAVRDGQTHSVAVLHLGDTAHYAAGGNPVTCGALTALPNGQWRLGGREFSPAEQAAVRRAEAIFNTRHSLSGATLPLDPTGTLAAQTPRPAETLRDWLRAGGFFVYPIFLCGILGICLIVERLRYLQRTHLSDPGFTAWLRGQTPADAAGRPESRLFAARISGENLPETQRDEMMEAALLAAEPELNRALGFLAALAGVAPLLGLLGTVSGMIHTFADIAVFGTGNSQILSGGISEALITTQLGLVVAVPLLLAHAWLNRALERRKALLEQRAMAILRDGGNTGVAQ